MFDSLMQLLRDVAGAADDSQIFHDGDPRVAVAALLIQLISIDGEVDDAERRKMREVLREHFDLPDAETSSLIEFASSLNRDAVDLYKFTSVLKRELDEAGRIQIIEMMWQLVFADGHIHEFEDNLVWRVSELLGVSRRDRIRLRKHVQAQTEKESE